MLRFATVILMVMIIPALIMGEIVRVPVDHPSIQAAIDAALPGDTVLVADSTFYENINFRGKAITVASQFLIDADPAHITNTIINGSQSDDPDSGSVVYFISGEDTNSILYGFTITGGTGTTVNYPTLHPYRGGGGILVISSGTQIVHNIVRNNSLSDSSADGCGMEIFGDQADHYATIRNNTITENNITLSTHGFGGGVGLFTRGTIIFEKNHVHSNTISATNNAWGGGIIVDGTFDLLGRIEIKGNHIQDNQVVSPFSIGGGIYVRNMNPLIVNNLISGNTALYGGGIEVYLTPSHAWPDSPPAIINNTIVDNSADYGGGIEISGPTGVPVYTSAVVVNTIVWNNHAVTEGPQINLFQQANIQVTHSNVQGGWPGACNLNMNPQFADTAFHLGAGSYCVGAGTYSTFNYGYWYTAPLTDLEGNSRPDPVDNYIDIGCYESTFPTPPHARDMTVINPSGYMDPAQESPVITCRVLNPHSDNIRIYAHLQKADSAEVFATAELFDDGNHHDATAGDGLFGGNFDALSTESCFRLSHSLENLTREETVNYPTDIMLTTIGPLVLDHHVDTLTTQWPTICYYELDLAINNLGSEITAENVTVRISTGDTNVTIASPLASYGDIAAGSIVSNTHRFRFGIPTEIIGNDPGYQNSVDFILSIASDDYIYWLDSTQVPLGIDGGETIKPFTFQLLQNYPNPFNPTTMIRWQLAAPAKVNLSIYNVLGEKVVTLFDGQQKAGDYRVVWDARAFASGVYFYRLQTDQGFVQTRKLVVLK
jgi:hypothetical protein